MGIHPVPIVRAGLVTWVAVAGLGGCAHSEPEASAPKAPPAAAEESGGEQADRAGERTEGDAVVSDPSAPDIQEHMNANFFLSGDAHSALIMGDVKTAREVGRELAMQTTSGAFPDSWQPYLTRLKQRAEALAHADNALEAGKALGLIAVACADCHFRLHAGPEPIQVAPLPAMEPPEDIRWRMFRHAVGLNQMWLGILIPSEEDFQHGTATLAHASTTAPRTHGQPIDAESHAEIEEIRAFAERARTATTPEQRAEAYGEMIARCGGCHAEQ